MGLWFHCHCSPKDGPSKSSSVSNWYSLQWQTVCDGRMWDTPLVSKFAITDVPFNVVINQKGRIVARQLKTKDLETKIEQLIK